MVIRIGFLFQDLKALFRLCIVANTSLVIQGLRFGDLGGQEGTNDSQGLDCCLKVILSLLNSCN